MVDRSRHNARPVRVLYVENGIGYGGAVICLRHLVRNLDRTRFEPIVVTGKDSAPYCEIAADAKWLPIADRVLDTLGWQRRISRSWLGSAFPRLATLSRKVLGRVDDVINLLPYVTRLCFAVRKYRPVLIHANNEPMCNRGALIAGRLFGVPVVCHVRGDIGKPSRLLRWLYSLPVHFIAVSRWVSETLIPLGVADGRRTCIYDGIELEDSIPAVENAHFRRRFGIPEDAFVVGLVGLLIPWKGQRLFLEAGQKLLSRIPKLYLVMVGGTPETWRHYEQQLRTLAAEAPFSDRVIFTGHVSDMASAYRALDVVVSASTSPEPFGMVAVEALALGRPLVAPAHGGAAETVDDGTTGLLFTPGDAESLAERIHALYADGALAKRLGLAGRAHVERAFAIEHHVAQVQAIYDDVLGSGNGSPLRNANSAHLSGEERNIAA